MEYKPSGRAVAEHRTEDEVALARTHIAKRMVEGATQQAIADELERLYGQNVTRAQVNYDWHAIRKEWRETTMADTGELVGRELAILDQVQKEAWDAWQRSKDDIKRQIIEEQKHDDLHQSQATAQSLARRIGMKAPRKTTRIEVTGNLPDAAYLTIIQRCVQLRAKLLGLFARANPLPGGELMGNGVGSFTVQFVKHRQLPTIIDNDDDGLAPPDLTSLRDDDDDD